MLGAGDLVEGRFAVLRIAGAGGMGTVYEARDTVTGERIAIKVMRSDRAEFDHTQRFEREAAILADLSHPNIVRSVSRGKLRSGEPYIAMEWLEGEDLSRHIQRGPMDVAESVRFARMAAEALGMAHARGIVHRDIKPSNLFVDARGESLKLLDFGASLLAGSTRLTDTGVFLGTPGYMAPEQVRSGGEIDARADVFALGAVLYECLTGEPAFKGASFVAVLASVLLEEPAHSRELSYFVSEPLGSFVARMLAKDPEKRPRDGSAVASALAALSDADLVPVKGHRIPSSEMKLSSITGRERRALVRILIGPPSEGRELEEVLGGDRRDEIEASLSREANEHGGEFHSLVGGAAVVVIAHHHRTPVDLGAQAARCALALRQIAPTRPIAIGMEMGNAEPSRATPSGALRTSERSEVIPASGGLPISLDETLAALLEARFEVRRHPLGPVLLRERGLAEGSRLLLGKPAPYLGRDHEMRMLEQCFEECVKGQVAQALIVLGASGLGKSRLGNEFVRGLRSRGEPISIWIGQADPLRMGSAFGLLGQALRGACGIREGESLSSQRDKLVARVVERLGEAEGRRAAEFLGELMGAEFAGAESKPLREARKNAKLLGERIEEAWVSFLGAECRAAPVVLLLEDLHWSDRPTVQLLDATLRDCKDLPLLVLGFARPEIREGFTGLWSSRNLREVWLRKLGSRASEGLVRHALGGAVGEETVERLVKLSDGNAFYLEELIRATADRKQQTLPETVVAMVQARLGQLDGPSRRVLRAASIFGESFQVGGVAALLGTEADTHKIRDRLAELGAQEFVARPRASRFPGEEELRFQHALIREGAYSMLTEDDRVLGHRLAGEWLERRGEHDPSVLAEHFERGRDVERAARYHALAAERSFTRHDLDGVLSHVKRGISCGATGEVLLELQSWKLLVHDLRWSFTEDVLRLGREARAAARPGSAAYHRIMHVLASFEVFSGNTGRLIPLVKEIVSVVPEREARTAAIASAPMIFGGLAAMGHRAIARETYDYLLRIEDSLEETELTERCHIWQARCYYLVSLWGKPWEAYLLATKAALGYAEAGELRSQVSAQNIAVLALGALGQLERGEALSREATALARRVRDPIVVAHALATRLCALVPFEDPRHGEEIRRLAREIIPYGFPVFTGLAHDSLARVLLLEGELAGAEVEARGAIEALATTAYHRQRPILTLFTILRRQGLAAEARAMVEQELSQIESHGNVGQHEVELRLAVVEARLEMGETHRALEALAGAKAALLAIAAYIGDHEFQESFFRRVPANRRTLELAERYGI